MTLENQTANIDAEMAASTTLLRFLLLLVADWLQRHQAATIDYLKAENRMLRERLGGRSIIFADAERRRLAEKVRALGRKALRELGTARAAIELVPASPRSRSDVGRWSFAASGVMRRKNGASQTMITAIAK